MALDFVGAFDNLLFLKNSLQTKREPLFVVVSLYGPFLVFHRGNNIKNWRNLQDYEALIDHPHES